MAGFQRHRADAPRLCRLKADGCSVPNEAKAFFEQNVTWMSDNPVRPTISPISRNLNVFIDQRKIIS